MAFKPSKNPKVLELTKSIRNRSVNLCTLKPIKLEELNIRGQPKRLCAWCAEVEILNKNQKYCSTNCSNCAMSWAYPQKEDALRFLLVRQEWKCIHCQYDYMPIMESLMAKDRAFYQENGSQFPALKLDEIPWYYLKRLKNKTPPERKPEVDHILAISKGGDALGLDNHQAICYTCHKAKTKKDLSGKRNKD